MKRRYSPGFTLLELIVTLALMVVFMAASGLFVRVLLSRWSAAAQQAQEEAQVRHFTALLCQDCLLATDIAWPSNALVELAEEGQVVRYVFEEASERCVRSVFQGQDKTLEETLLTGITNMQCIASAHSRGCELQWIKNGELQRICVSF